MSRSHHLRNKIPEKVVLEKTGTHVEVTAGPYTKRELREMLLSSISLLPELSSDRETELLRLSGLDQDDLRRIKDGEIYDADGKEILGDHGGKKYAAIKLVDLIKNELNTDLERDLFNLLSSKGISDDLINRIIKYGLNDETRRLLKALGLTDEEIAKLIGMWETLVERQNNSEKSCLSLPSSSDEYMNVNGFYLMSHFRIPLTKALGDIVSKKPWNPTEYLGHWLLNFKICEERSQKQKEYDAELQAEREIHRIKVSTGINLSKEDDGEEELGQDWNFMEYEGD